MGLRNGHERLPYSRRDVLAEPMQILRNPVDDTRQRSAALNRLDRYTQDKRKLGFGSLECLALRLGFAWFELRRDSFGSD